ncbi:MAG: ATP-binding protein [Carbonactinosporaceae bacterium]
MEHCEPARGLPPERQAAWCIAAGDIHVACARRRTRQVLDSWGLAELSDVTELLVSELVTNALRHAAGPIRVHLLRTEQALVCEIADGDAQLPHVRLSNLEDEGGRGLRLVMQLARCWGARPEATGKVVWFEQALHAPDSARADLGSSAPSRSEVGAELPRSAR